MVEGIAELAIDGVLSVLVYVDDFVLMNDRFKGLSNKFRK